MSAFKRNGLGNAFNFNCQTEFYLAPPENDPVTTKPLATVTGLVDINGRELPPFIVTCNTLESMGKAAKIAMAMWESRQNDSIKH
jgi:hypothetical protein